MTRFLVPSRFVTLCPLVNDRENDRHVRKLVGCWLEKEKKKRKKKREEKRGSYTSTISIGGLPASFRSFITVLSGLARPLIYISWPRTLPLSRLLPSTISKVHGKWDRRHSANRSRHRFVLRFTDAKRWDEIAISLSQVLSFL